MAVGARKWVIPTECKVASCRAGVPDPALITSHDTGGFVLEEASGTRVDDLRWAQTLGPDSVIEAIANEGKVIIKFIDKGNFGRA